MRQTVGEFFKREESSGLLLMAVTVLALLVANSSLYGFYTYALKDLHIAHWINDGLMAIFFLVVGLEIKREVKEGALSTFKSAMVPFLVAVGGVVVPAMIFYLINMDHPENIRGWAIPTATDIAFSLGLLALIGSRAPLSLKILLTAIAIIDDLAAILIIAVFYTAQLNMLMIAAAVAAVLIMVALNFLNVRAVGAYLLFGFLAWLALLQSGVHPTMAGVATAFCIPLYRKDKAGDSVVDRLIHVLHPYTAFFILPVFAFANAGVSLGGVTVDTLRSPLLLGIVVGLVVGKAVGITGVLLLLKPAGLAFRDKMGLGFLCGIGFTMSLFIGELAFATDESLVEIRLGVILASCLSACMAYLFLRRGDAARS